MPNSSGPPYEKALALTSHSGVQSIRGSLVGASRHGSGVTVEREANRVEFTQMSDAWFKHLEHRRSQGADAVARWQAHQAAS